MSFVKDLFGGSESSSQVGPVSTVPKEFKELRQPVADALLGLFGPALQQGGGSPSGEGILTAPITGLETSLVNRVGGLVGGDSPLQAGANRLLQQTIGGEFLSPDGNPFLSAQIRAAQRPLIEAFKDVALPRFQRAFAAAGQNIGPGGSSAFDRAAAISTRGLLNTLGDISTNLAGQNFQAERGRQVQAVEQVGQINTQQVQSTIAGLQAVALPRLIEQFGINQGTAEFNRRIEVVLQALGITQGLNLGATAQAGTATGSTSPNIIGTLIGGAGLAGFGFGTPGAAAPVPPAVT